MTRIPVLQLLSGLAVEGPLGGVARFGIELSRHLDPDRFAVTLCGLWDYHTGYEARWQAQLSAEGIPTVVAAPWDAARPYQSCVAALQGARAQLTGTYPIIHSHGEFADLAALALRQRLGAQGVVRTVHNEREWSKRPLFGALFTHLLYPLAFTQELGVAQTVVENLNRRPLAKLVGQRAQLLHNALNVSRFSQGATGQLTRAALGLPATAYLIGSVGRLRPQKGYHIFLAAAAQVRQSIPNAHFVLIGDGELRPELEAQARALGITEAVTFLGPRHDVEQLYGLLDLFVSSSLWEGLPTVILEAMAAGRPVVATAVAGTRELVRDGETGLLAPPADPAALAAAIVRMAGAADMARAMAARAKSFVSEYFAIDKVAQRHAELYTALLEGNHSA